MNAGRQTGKRWLTGAAVGAMLLIFAGPITGNHASANLGWHDVPSTEGDSYQAHKAGRYAEKEWPNQFAGRWGVLVRAESQQGKVRVYAFAFTRKARQKVKILRKRFPLSDSRYRAATRPNSAKRLRKVFKRVTRDERKVRHGKLRLPDGRRSLYTYITSDPRSSSVWVGRPWAGPAFRRWVKKRYNGLVTVKKGNFADPA